ncbi:MAG: glycosyltransferase [Oligoflexales bacterium]
MIKTRNNIAWHVVSNRWNSAITEYALSTARSMQMQGWDCRFLALQGSPCESRAKDYGFSVKSFAKFSLTSYPQISTPYSSELPSALITYGGPETTLANLVIDKTKTRFLRFRGDDRKKSGTFARLLYKLSTSKVDVVLVPNNGLKLFYQEQGNVPVEKVTLGCDAARYAFRPASEFKLRNEMMIVGRLDPVKGHRKFFEYAARLRGSWKHHERFPLIHIVGQPANVSSDHIHGWANDNGFTLGKDYLLSDRYVEDLPILMQRAGLGVVCSVGSEQICRVAEEFFLCGCPVLVSGVGGLAEIASAPFGFDYSSSLNLDQVNAFIVKCLSEDQNQRVQRAARAQEEYSYQTMGKCLNKVLNEI